MTLLARGARRRLRFLALLGAVWLALPREASAQVPEDQQGDPAAESRRLFDEGQALVSKGAWAEACERFQAAHALNPTGGTALHGANCYENVGRPELALALYQWIIERSHAQPEARLRIAEGRVAAIRSRMAERDAAKPAEPDRSPEPSRPAEPSSPPAPAPEDGGPSRSPLPAYAALGVGSAGLVAGSLFGLLALSEASEAKGICNGLADPCAPGEREPAEMAQDSARTMGWVSTVAFGVGVAGVLTGVVLLATGGGQKTAGPRASARGLVVRF